MINPAQISLTQNDGTKRNLIIEPVLQKQGEKLTNTGEYKIYKDAFGDESALFTEPLEMEKANNSLADADNPDYLGTFTFSNQNFNYHGDLLSTEEQKQVSDYISRH